MAKLSNLRRDRAAAVASLDKALKHKKGGIASARRAFQAATSALLRAELGRRKAEPLLRSQAGRQTGDLFSQAGI